MSRSHRATERAYLASAVAVLIASCSIPEHEPVLAETGGAGGAQGGGAPGGSGGKSGASGGTGGAGANASGGATSKGTGGSGVVTTEGGAGGTAEGGVGAEGGVAGSTDVAGAGGTSTGGVIGAGGTTSSGGSAGAATMGGAGGIGGKNATGGAGGTGGKSATGGAGGTGGTGGKSATGGTGGTGGKSSGCSAGDVGPEGPSCTGLSTRCGSTADSCCVSLCVPGGSFTLGGAVEAKTSQATISSYFLDKYEVTVGRFRKFVTGYDTWRAAGNPKQDAAKHPLIASSGWQTTWSNSLPANAAALQTNVTSKCDSFASWSTGNGNDPLPMNCVDWYEAFAFCAWDSGRLPTETEWEYAAAGGDDQRTYPWGSPVPSTARANYGCLDGPSGCSELSALVPAGSKPNGAGRWGHNDLAGSVNEWVLDLYQTPYPTTRSDGAVVIESQQLFLRVYRSSAFGEDAAELPVAKRKNEEPLARGSYFGLRCARLSSP